MHSYSESSSMLFTTSRLLSSWIRDYAGLVKESKEIFDNDFKVDQSHIREYEFVFGQEIGSIKKGTDFWVVEDGV